MAILAQDMSAQRAVLFLSPSPPAAESEPSPALLRVSGPPRGNSPTTRSKSRWVRSHRKGFAASQSRSKEASSTGFFLAVPLCNTGISSCVVEVGVRQVATACVFGLKKSRRLRGCAVPRAGGVRGLPVGPSTVAGNGFACPSGKGSPVSCFLPAFAKLFHQTYKPFGGCRSLALLCGVTHRCALFPYTLESCRDTLVEKYRAIQFTKFCHITLSGRLTLLCVCVCCFFFVFLLYYAADFHLW